MLELDYITVRGFKSIAAIEKLRLGAMNVLIGPNGSGKSNFVGVFSFLNAIRAGGLQDYVVRAGGADKVLHFGARKTDKLYIDISFEDRKNRYEITLRPAGADELVPSSEFAYFWNKKRFPDEPYDTNIDPAGREAGISREARTSSRGSGVIAYVRNRLNRWKLYHFHDTSDASPMKKTADVNDNRHLRPDGSNLAAFLHLLKMQYPDSYRLIAHTVGQVAPFFEDFQLEPQRLNPSKILLEWRHAGTDAYFDASSLSDGTLRFMALATLFLQPTELRPSVMLVDEPELGMHPFAITLLASLMKQAAVETQVIVSTQSSLLLDHFEPEDVLVADRVDGSTRLTRLNPSDLEPWLDQYSLGQLWEKNELGGRPKME